MPDKKLKKAMEQIKKICKQHDIAAQVTLVSTTHSEYLFALSPSWSVVTLKGNELRFRSKREDFSSKEVQQKYTNLSTHMLCQIRDISAQSFDTTSKILNNLSEHMDIEHEPFKNHEPHQEDDDT